MNLSFEQTLPIDGKGSYIASQTIVNPTDMQAHNLQTRAGRRIAAKTKRTPELVREGFMRLSPVAIPVADDCILGVNLTKTRLWEWAKRSRIQSLVYITFDEKGEMQIEYYGSETHLPMEILHDNTVINTLREVNQKIEHNLKKAAATSGLDQLTILDLATNGAGVTAWRYRRKVYSMCDIKEEYAMIQQNDRMMMRMGRICSVGEDLDILYFMEDSAPIPHFHIVDKATSGGVFHTCIKIETPEYYRHTIEQYEYFHHDGNEQALSAKQCQMLMDALNRIEHFDKLSNWQYFLYAWNINNPDHELDIHTPMPDYMKL